MRKTRRLSFFFLGVLLSLVCCFDTLTAQTLTVSPASLTFNATAGGAPQMQTAAILTPQANLPYNTTVVTTSGGPWLSVSPATGTTNNTIQVQVNPASLTAATYTGTVQVNVPGAAGSPQTIAVTLNVASSGGATLTVAPTSLTFDAQANGAPPASQNLTVTTNGSPVTFTASAITDTGGNWLLVNPASATTGATTGIINVAINQAGLAAGVYTGKIRISSVGLANSPLDVPVVLNINTNPQLTVTPTSLSFPFQVGGANPPAQTLNVTTSSGTSVPFAVTVNYTSGTPGWLVVNQSGTTPNPLSVSVTPQALGLAPGTYTANIVLSSAGASNSPVTIPVSLIVSTLPIITFTPASITFTSPIGGTAPAPQTVNLSTTGGQLAFTLTATTQSGGNWLTATPANGTAPGAITIQANTTNLIAGTYNGTVTVSAPGAGNPTTNIPVTLTVTNAQFIGASPASMTFNFQTGLPNPQPPAPQSIFVNSSGVPLNYSVTTTTTDGGPWLTVTPTSGSTPATLTVAVRPGVMAAGTYTGKVSIAATGAANSPLDIPVTMLISTTALMNVSPASLGFSAQVGSTTLPPPQTVALTTTDNSSVLFNVAAATTSGGNWLLVGATNPATPANLSVTVNPTGLPQGLYMGTVTVKDFSLANNPQTIAVSLAVTNNISLTVTPAALAFSQQVGAAAPAPQTVNVGASTGTLNYSVSASTNAGGAWLTVTPASGGTPGVLTITANGSNLAAGTYTGSVVLVSPGTVNSPVTIPVTLTVTTPITATPTTLSFAQVLGSPPPAAQTITLASPGANINFTVTATTASGGTWLAVTPPSGFTPATLTVTANSANLATGTYTGSITINSPGATNATQTIPVSLLVSPVGTLSVTPNPLTFSFTLGGPNPAPQSLSVGAGGVPLPFTATVATASGGNWLTVAPTTGTAPATLTVGANPGSLAAGTYTGTITIASPGATNNPVVVNVSFTVANVPLPAVLGISNAGSFTPGAVAPGLIVTIGGMAMGPTTPSIFTVTAGRIPTSLGGVRVLFDAIPAPLLYVSATQINAIVPYAIAGRISTGLQVEFNGRANPTPINLSVVSAAPAIFALNAAGSGQGAILNENGTVNGPATPAPKGSVVAIYATGEGQTSPAGEDGLVTTTTLKKPLQTVSATIGGQQAEVQYGGSAPSLVSGVMQVNVKIPDNAPSGAAIPIVVTVGAATSQPGITIAVQ